jgi:hypothetical protein
MRDMLRQHALPSLRLFAVVIVTSCIPFNLVNPNNATQPFKQAHAGGNDRVFGDTGCPAACVI